MNAPLWTRWASLPPERKATFRAALIATAKRLAREQNERDRLNPRQRVRDDYHDDENDYDKAYHGGWL